MNRKIIIYGAGGFGREVQWLIERINSMSEPKWEIQGYIDDGVEVGKLINGYPVIGGFDDLMSLSEDVAVAFAIGSAKVRKKVAIACKKNKNLYYPNLVDPSVICSERIRLGEGNIICAGNILTVDIEIGDFNIINLDCTIGHDAILKSYVTLYPSVNISGMVRLGEESEVGTGSRIIQGIDITNSVIIGAGSTVIKNIDKMGTYVGSPVRRVVYEK